jgi:hypothetical protein
VNTYLCSLCQLENGVSARLRECNHSSDALCVRAGQGSSTGQALSQALGLSEGRFLSELDEIDCCVAAPRNRVLKIAVEGRTIRALGLA